MSLSERVLCFVACVGPDHDRAGAWLEAHPWAVAALLVGAALLAAAVDGGAI